MKIDVTQTLKQLDGTPMQDVDANKEVIDATLGRALVNALLASKQKPDDGITKVKKYELAKRIYAGGEIDLTSEEVTMCKQAVEEAFPSPLVVGQVIELLEG